MRTLVLLLAGLTAAACFRRAPAPAPGTTPASAAPADAAPTGVDPLWPSEAQLRALAERVSAQIVRMRPGSKVEITKDHEVQFEGGARMAIKNLWWDCRDEGAGCADQIERFARVALAQLSAGPALRLANLRVVLATEASFRSLGPEGQDVIRRPWIDPLVQVLAEDHPDIVGIVPRKRIAPSGIADDQLFERGLSNLRKACPEPITSIPALSGQSTPVRLTQFTDSYTAARLLVPERWSKIAAKAGGHLYAAAPARDALIWTTNPDAGARRELAALAQTMFHTRPYPISPAILRWTGRGWALEDANGRN